MFLLWLGISTAIIVLIVVLSKNVRNKQMTPLKKLQMRFANGEIDEAEFNQKKSVLEKSK